LLADLRQQVILGALAGLYHRREKELRDFIERESRHDVQKAKLMKVAWHGPITDIFDLLTQFGWDVRSEQDPYLEQVAAFTIPPGQDVADEEARALQPPDPVPPSIVEPDTHTISVDFTGSIEWTSAVVS
jgi:hypothetical protein